MLQEPSDRKARFFLAGCKDEGDLEPRNVKNVALGAGIGQESYSFLELVVSQAQWAP